MRPAYAVVVDLYAKTRAIVTVDVVKAIQDDAFEAGAADMRERAALAAQKHFHAGRWPSQLPDAIRALPLTAPAAGVPVDETKERVVADCCAKCGGRKWIKWNEIDSYHACRCPLGKPVDETGRGGTDPSKGSALP